MKDIKDWIARFEDRIVSHKGEKEKVMTTLGNVKITKEGLEVQGNIRLNGQVVVENIFSSESIYISKNSQVECNLEAKYVKVEGEVKGRIIAKERIEILSGGKVFGGIFTPHLDVEGSFHGKCNVEEKSRKNVEKIEEKVEEKVEEKETEAFLPGHP
jgi:cytoskeletal protein CcmA (bactofilin family)